MISLMATSFLATPLLFGSALGVRPAWQTLQNHFHSRPNLERMLKPTPYHYESKQVDYGGKHPFEQRSRHLEDFSALRDEEVLEYDQTISALRLRFITDPLESRTGQSTENDAAIQTILNDVLPAVQAKWVSHLNVFQVQGNIPMESSVCSNIFQGQIPESLVSNGVDNADLVVIVSAFEQIDNGYETFEYCSNGVLASATSCVLDQFDRPIVGFINFCLDTVGDARRMEEGNEGSTQVLTAQKSNLIHESKFNNAEGTVSDETTVDTILIATHEVGHVLGVDSNLFIFFRDPTTGEPRTPRPFLLEEVTCVDGTSEILYFPDENTIRSEITSENQLSYLLVTPRVTTVTRNQFDCQSLMGARLENRLGGGCTGSHFDERYFYTELMSPVFSGTSDVLSPLTLALLEDSGWYQVNYEGSQVSSFGHGAGCDFVEKPCIINDSVPAYATGTFCTDVSQLKSDGLLSWDNSLMCDPSHRSIGFCDLFDTTAVASIGGVEFDENAISYFTDTSLKAVGSRADYCPIAGGISAGFDCTDESGSTKGLFYTGETFETDSRCINFEFNPSWDRTLPGCFNVICDVTERKVVVNGVTCEYDEQLLPVGTVDGESVNMICPKLKTICPELFCPAGCSGRGVCNFSTGQCECFESEGSSNCMSDNFVAPPPTIPSSGTSFAELMITTSFLGVLALVLS